MTIKLRNRKITTNGMSPKDLHRLLDVIAWELSKHKQTTPKYQILHFCYLIVKRKFRKAVCTSVVSYNLS